MANDTVLIVNETSGEMSAPSEYLGSLQSLERAVHRWDNAVATLKGDLKIAKESREKAVADLRYAIREVKVLAQKARKRQSNGVK